MTAAAKACHSESPAETLSLEGEGSQSLPASWRLLSFDEAVEPVSDEGKRIDQSDYLAEGALPVIDQGEQFIGGYTNDGSKAYCGPLPVIVFGDHTRRVKFVEFRFAIGAQGVKLLRPREGWFPKFFAYLLPTLDLPDRGYSRHYQFVRKLRFPQPPEPEQRRIVTEIEKQFTRLEAGLTALRRVVANLKRFRASVLKAACEGKLVENEVRSAKADPSPRGATALVRSQRRSVETGEQLLQRILKQRREKWNGKGKYKEPAAPDTTGLPKLPEGWCWATLNQVGQEGRPIIYGIIKPGPHVPDGVPYVRVKEMKYGRIDVTTLKRASPARAAKFARATLAAGDVLISKDGTIGRVAVVPPELAGGNITQHVMRAPIHPFMCRDYVVWAIRSNVCQRWLTGETRGVALQGVNVEDFRRLPVPVPPLAEQQRIVAEVERRLSVVDELEAVVENNLKRASRLRQAVLHEAFAGRLLRQEANVAAGRGAAEKSRQVRHSSGRK